MLDPQDEQRVRRAASTDELRQIPFNEQQPKQFFKISSELNQEDWTELTKFLKENIDVFAWSPADMLGVNLDVITHKLNANPACRPIIQKKRKFSPDRTQAI